MKRALFIVIVGVFICSLAISSFAAEVPGVTKDSITIGAIIDMTGPASYIMTQEHYGALTYFDKAYAEGVFKRKIIVKAEDGGYEPPPSVSTN